MKLRKGRRCEDATTERQTHTFEHLAVENTPLIAFALWDSCHQQGKRGDRASAWLTRGDIGVARSHVERSGACLRQHGATLADTDHARCVYSIPKIRRWTVQSVAADERVPGQTHKRQLQNVVTLLSHADVWEEKIHPRPALKVAQMMWGGHQVAIKEAIRWELPI